MSVRAMVLAGAICIVAQTLALSTRTTATKTRLSRDIASLEQWARQRGVYIHPRIQLLENDTELSSSSGWGLERHASSSSGLGLETGTVILRVPATLVWNAGALHDEWVSSNLDTQYTTVWQRVLAQLCATAVTRDHVAEFILLVRLLEESRGRRTDDTASDATNSPWQTWLESLPQTLTTGVSFTESERQCLPAYTRALVEYERIKLQIFSSALATLSAAANSSSSLVAATVPSRGTLRWLSQDLSDAEIQWAYQIVSSRCWKRPVSEEDDSGDKAWRRTDLVPLGDMFNHREPSNVVVTATTNDSIDFVYTGSDVDSHNDTGLYLSYGLGGNPHRFLAVFGFVDESMPYVWSQLTFPNPDACLQELGCDDRSEMVIRAVDGAISTAIWDCLLYAMLVAAEAKRAAMLTALVDETPVESPLQADSRLPLSVSFFKACRMARSSSSETDTTGFGLSVQQSIEYTQYLHAEYRPQTTAILRNHLSNLVQELAMLRKTQIQPRADETSSGMGRSPSLQLIQRHNHFLTGVFAKALDRLGAV
jgi:hypothetical protein